MSTATATPHSSFVHMQTEDLNSILPKYCSNVKLNDHIIEDYQHQCDSCSLLTYAKR